MSDYHQDSLATLRLVGDRCRDGTVGAQSLLIYHAHNSHIVRAWIMISNIENADDEINNLVARIERLKKNKAIEVEEINFLLTCPEIKPSGDHLKGRPE